MVARMGQFYRRRGGTDRIQMVNPNRIAEEVIELTRPRWQDIPQGRGVVIELETDLDPSAPEPYCDETELREALTNLVLNAVEALPQGGTITIATRGKRLKTVPGDDGPPSHLVVEVRDTGLGMDDRTRRRCLEPFFSTKRDSGGTGLGLAMVYGMMERQEGTVQVDTAQGKGTTVTLIFPLRKPEKVRVTNPATAPTASSPCKILCVDDEPLLRELLKEALQYAHHTVEVADGGQSGVDLFCAALQKGEPFDVVITDLGMPHFDGRHVAQRVKAQSPQTPVIMLTGWREMLSDQEEASSRVDAILAKPPRLAELAETLARVTAGKKAA
jgi:CheY-like chemotaxis protein